MDKVVLDGVEYVKASAAAKQFHYTPDYVGQLCRAKKVDARLVGRTWFVNPESLNGHKNATHQKPIEPAKNSLSDDYAANNIEIKRVEVNAPLKNKTAKSAIFNSIHPATLVPINKGPATAISYHTDAETLLPNLSSKAELTPHPESNVHVRSSTKKYLHIEPAFAKKLKISSEKNKHTSFTSTDLPDVALSGKLSVSAYNERIGQPYKKTVPEDTLTPAEHQPKLAPSSEISLAVQGQIDEEVNFPMNSPLSVWIRIMPLLVTLIAIVTAAALLSAVSEITVTQAISTARFILDIDYFSQLFAR
jgi:hypothetical protein